MGIFDSLLNLIGGASDVVQNSVGDAVGGITDNQVVQDVQDQVTNVTDGVTEATGGVSEQGQNVVDDLKQNIGL